MAKLNIGFCGIDETPIFTRENNRSRPNENYVEISLALSDGTVARHGICRYCINNLDDKKIQKLLSRIKETWSEEMAGWATDKQFARMDKLQVKAFDPEEHKAISKFKVVKEKEHQDHLKETKTQKKIADDLGEDFIS